MVLEVVPWFEKFVKYFSTTLLQDQGKGSLGILEFHTQKQMHYQHCGCAVLSDLIRISKQPHNCNHIWVKHCSIPISTQKSMTHFLRPAKSVIKTHAANPSKNVTVNIGPQFIILLNVSNNWQLLDIWNITFTKTYRLCLTLESVAITAKDVIKSLSNCNFQFNIR